MAVTISCSVTFSFFCIFRFVLMAGAAFLHIIASVSEHWTKYSRFDDMTIFEYPRDHSYADYVLSAQCLVGISCGLAVLLLVLYVVDLFCNVIKDRSARSSPAMSCLYLLTGLCEIAGIVCFAIAMSKQYGAEIDHFGWSFFVSCAVALLCLLIGGLFCKEWCA